MAFRAPSTSTGREGGGRHCRLGLVPTGNETPHSTPHTSPSTLQLTNSQPASQPASPGIAVVVVADCRRPPVQVAPLPSRFENNGRRRVEGKEAKNRSMPNPTVPRASPPSPLLGVPRSLPQLPDPQRGPQKTSGPSQLRPSPLGFSTNPCGSRAGWPQHTDERTHGAVGMLREARSFPSPSHGAARALCVVPGTLRSTEYSVVLCSYHVQDNTVGIC